MKRGEKNPKISQREPTPVPGERKAPVIPPQPVKKTKKPNEFVVFVNQYKTLISISVALILLGWVFSKPEVEQFDPVLHLNRQNFDETIKNNRYVIVEFFAPWCGHCKQIAPEYKQASVILGDIDPKVILAKVDGTQERELMDRFEIKGYPTFFFFIDGKKEDFTVGRNDQEIVKTVLSKLGINSLNLSTKEKIDKNIEDNDVTVVYFGQSTDDLEYLTYTSIALDFKDIVFVHTFNQEARAQFKAKQRSIVIFRKFETEPRVDYDSDTLTVSKGQQFIKDHIDSTVYNLSDRLLDRLYQGGEAGLILFTPASQTDRATQIVEETFIKSARSLKGEILFGQAKIDYADEKFSNFASNLGIEFGDEPKLIIFRGQPLAKHIFDGKQINESSITNFIIDHKMGKLKQFLKSAPIPESNNEPVQVVVGQTFYEFVNHPSKHVLLEVYAPWCGHCKNLEPIYKELAEKYKNNESIIIAQMDGTLNDPDYFSTEGYPTLKFFKLGSKETPLDVNVERTLDGLSNFIENQLNS